MLNSYIKLLILICVASLQPMSAHEADCALPNNGHGIKSAELTGACSKPMEIEHGVVEFVDGKPILNMTNMVRLERDLKRLRHGDKGMIAYNGQLFTLDQLIIMEQEQGFDKNMLSLALDKFEELSLNYLQEARGFKAVMVSIIEQWAKQRNKTDSILLQWGQQPAGSETAQLRKLVPTCFILGHFVADLSCFLQDMRFSCKKSWKQFQDMLKEKQAHK